MLRLIGFLIGAGLVVGAAILGIMVCEAAGWISFKILQPGQYDAAYVLPRVLIGEILFFLGLTLATSCLRGR